MQKHMKGLDTTVKRSIFDGVEWMNHEEEEEEEANSEGSVKNNARYATTAWQKMLGALRHEDKIYGSDLCVQA